MPKFPVPESNVEWPEYQFRAFPAWVGRDANGADLIAHDADEAKALLKEKVYPKVLGVNKAGNDIIALNADEERSKAGDVVEKASEKPAKNDLTSPKK